nr:MAG TPA: hypothetical protein [Caudoviricetes sp.]
MYSVDFLNLCTYIIAQSYNNVNRYSDKYCTKSFVQCAQV